MNRRELLKSLVATLATASIVSIPVEAIIDLSDSEIIKYLRHVQQDLINMIVNPPMIMKEDGTVEIMSTEVQNEALRHVDKLLKELS